MRKMIRNGSLKHIYFRITFANVSLLECSPGGHIVQTIIEEAPILKIILHLPHESLISWYGPLDPKNCAKMGVYCSFTTWAYTLLHSLPLDCNHTLSYCTFASCINPSSMVPIIMFHESVKKAHNIDVTKICESV